MPEDDPTRATGSPATPSPDEAPTISVNAPARIPASDRIGPYRILEPLGEGGMGVVYLAEQEEPVRRRVALKVIKAGMESRHVIARFEAERQALALMSHSNIATVLEAGSTPDGLPYFAMEYVPGIPITRYCDKHKLSTRERLELFVPACRALHHAHEKGVVHRDIKPTNVLVGLQDGERIPKIIDFGVAKALGRKLTDSTVHTQHGTMIGTPSYMSPEQVEGSAAVDARSDVYSLGVLLYELLVGSLPFEADAAFELQRRIVDEDALTPSQRLDTLTDTAPEIAQLRQTDLQSLLDNLRSDLDWIAMKAMDKDPARRYATAKELADDLGRHLAGDPVSARPPSTGYKLRKAAVRNRGPIQSILAALSALVAGLVAGFKLGSDSD